MKRICLQTVMDAKNQMLGRPLVSLKSVFEQCPDRVAADVRRRKSARFGPGSPPPHGGGYNFQTRSTADVSGQRRLPRNGHRIPIVFLTSATEEEQCVPIRRHQVSAQTDQQKEIAAGRPISARMLLKITEEEII